MCCLSRVRPPNQRTWEATARGLRHWWHKAPGSVFPHSTSILFVSLGFAGFTSDFVFSRWKCVQAEANTTIARSSSAAGGSQGRRSVPLESIGQLLCAGLGALNILESQHVVLLRYFSVLVIWDIVCEPDGFEACFSLQMVFLLPRGRWGWQGMIIVIVSETIAPLITKYILLYM